MFQAFNILRYKIGQKYNSHYDAFDPQEYGPQKSQRVISFFSFFSRCINIEFMIYITYIKVNMPHVPVHANINKHLSQ